MTYVHYLSRVIGTVHERQVGQGAMAIKIMRMEQNASVVPSSVLSMDEKSLAPYCAR